MARTPAGRWHVRGNVLLAFALAALAVLGGAWEGFHENVWYWAIALWAFALIALAYARSRGRVRIETPLFKYEGNLAEDAVPRTFEGDEVDEEKPD